jgi:hypothetical protein
MLLSTKQCVSRPLFQVLFHGAYNKEARKSTVYSYLQARKSELLATASIAMHLTSLIPTPSSQNAGSKAHPSLSLHHPLLRQPRRLGKYRKKRLSLARKAFCPFSIGPRGCIGKSMALMEMRLTLARLLYLFEFEDVRDGVGEDEGGDLGMVDHFTSQKTGPNVRVRRRV